MSTARDLINSSFRLIGVLAGGETASAQEMNDALATLNDMIDSWSNERLTIFNVAPETFPLVPAQQTYTMGTGGDFDTARPLKIENAKIQVVTNGQTNEYPLQISNQDQWADIRIKTVTTSLPSILYMDGAYPLQNLNLWPIPSVANSIILYSWKPLSDFSTLNTVASLPPGYSKALRYNLAIELAPEYGKQADQSVVAGAIEGKENIKRANITPRYMATDSALQDYRKPFNWLTGE